MSLIDKIAKGGPLGIYSEHVIPGSQGPIAPAKPFAVYRIPEPHLYYVYVWYDPRNGSPIYVGKGTEKGTSEPYRFKRAHRNHTNGNAFLGKVLRAMRREGFAHVVRIHCCFIEEWAAFDEEIKLIAEYGRRDLGTGTLCNLTEGGEGAPELSAATLRRMSDKTSAQWNDAKGRRLRVEVRKGVTNKFANDPEYRAMCKRRGLKVKKNFADKRAAKKVVA